MLAATSTATPSRVTAGWRAAASRPCQAASSALWRSCAARASAGLASSTISPLPPSTMISAPGRMRSKSSGAETTAGMPSARARMAVCAVGPPRRVQNARMRPRSSWIVSAGVRSSARMIEATAGPALSSRFTPRSTACTRRSTSRTSAARAEIYSPGRAASSAAYCSSASWMAAPALLPVASAAWICSSSSGSRSIMRCASKMAASPAPTC